MRSAKIDKVWRVDVYNNGDKDRQAGYMRYDLQLSEYVSGMRKARRSCQIRRHDGRRQGGDVAWRRVMNRWMITSCSDRCRYRYRDSSMNSCR